MESYRAQLRALNTVLENSSTYEAFSHQVRVWACEGCCQSLLIVTRCCFEQVHKTSVAALALSDRIEAAAPLRDEVRPLRSARDLETSLLGTDTLVQIRALRDAARSDQFIEVALQTLPQHVIDDGAPSVGQLQERFAVVKKVAHRAALAPEDAGLVGQLFGTALSYLMIPPGGPIEGDDTDAIFSRADYALKAGDIERALDELKALSGVPAQVSRYVRLVLSVVKTRKGEESVVLTCRLYGCLDRDWISAAESRLAVEQTAKVMKAHVALLAASCS